MNGTLFSDGAGASTVDVSAFLDSDVPNRIAGIVAMGVLVAIGTTRDRGAISLTITNDGDYDRGYFRSADEAIDYLDRATESLRRMGLGDPGADLPAPQTPTRRRQKLT